MSSFIRFAGAAAVVLSLGFLVAASAIDVTVPVITGKDAVSLACAKVFANVDVNVKALLDCTTLADLEAKIKVLVALFLALADDLVKIGAGVVVTVEAKASIVACIAAIIHLFVQVCIQLTLKFGVDAVLKLFVSVDACLKAVLVALSICIPDILALVAAAVNVFLALCIKVQFKLCLGVLGIHI